MTQKPCYITEKGMERKGEGNKRKNKENKEGCRNTTVERKKES